MKVREAIAAAARRLADSSDTPRLDAELLMAHALGAEREALLLSRLESETPHCFAALLRRRLANEPLAYITGRRAFWTVELEVGPGVLIPRPDSETLIEAALAHFGQQAPARILDLGTGPGTLLLAALDQWPEATGVGVDLTETALGFAKRNAERLGLAGRARFRLGDWGEEISETFDLILCNPPYISAGASLPAEVANFEPATALFAGGDGLDDYRKLAPQIARLLAPDGIACIEIGAGQEPAVRSLFTPFGLQADGRKDLGGHVRCLTLRP
jgi:release factor glutamine methyltransferase